MNEQYQQAINHVKKRLAEGVPLHYLQMELKHNKWSDESINYVLSMASGHHYQQPTTVANKAQKPVDPHRTRNAVLWICSPFIMIFGVLILQFLARLIGLDGVFINILSILAGLAGVVLFFVGPLVGIIMLIKD